MEAERSEEENIWNFFFFFRWEIIVFKFNVLLFTKTALCWLQITISRWQDTFCVCWKSVDSQTINEIFEGRCFTTPWFTGKNDKGSGIFVVRRWWKLRGSKRTYTCSVSNLRVTPRNHRFFQDSVEPYVIFSTTKILMRLLVVKCSFVTNYYVLAQICRTNQ